MPWVEGLPSIWEWRKVDLSFVPIAHSMGGVSPLPAVETGLGETLCTRVMGVSSFRLGGLWSW